MDPITAVLSIEELVQSIFRFLGFGSVCRFALTSQQLGIYVPSKFLTTIAPSISVSQKSFQRSLDYLLSSSPLRTLPKLRTVIVKHCHIDIAQFFLSIRPSLPRLTTLRFLSPAAYPAGGAEDPIPMLLRECTSLATLVYIGDLIYLGAYLTTQPKLSHLAVSCENFRDCVTDLFRTIDLIDKLEHRPKIISIDMTNVQLCEMFEMFELPENWARETERLLLNFTPETLIRPPFPGQYSIECLEENFCFPLQKMWFFSFDRPFRAHMPLVPYLLTLHTTLPIKHLMANISRYLPVNAAPCERAATFHHVLKHRPEPRLFELMKSIFLSKRNLAKAAFPHPFVWLIAATPQELDLDLSSMVPDIYKPMETIWWAIHTHLSLERRSDSWAFSSPTIIRTFPNTANERFQVILSAGCTPWPREWEKLILKILPCLSDPTVLIQFLVASGEERHEETALQLLKKLMPLPPDILDTVPSKLKRLVLSTIVAQPDLLGIAPERIVACPDFLWVYTHDSVMFSPLLKQFLESYHLLPSRLLRHYRVEIINFPCKRLFRDRSDFTTTTTADWRLLLKQQQELFSTMDQPQLIEWWQQVGLSNDTEGNIILNLLLENLGTRHLEVLLSLLASEIVSSKITFVQEVTETFVRAFDHPSTHILSQIKVNVLDRLLNLLEPVPKCALVTISIAQHVLKLSDDNLLKHLLERVISEMPGPSDPPLLRAAGPAEGDLLVAACKRSPEIAQFISERKPHISQYNLPRGSFDQRRPFSLLWWAVLDDGPPASANALAAAYPGLLIDGRPRFNERAQIAIEQGLFHLALANLCARTWKPVQTEEGLSMLKAAFSYADSCWERFNKELKEAILNNLSTTNSDAAAISCRIWLFGIVKSAHIDQSPRDETELLLWLRSWDTSRIKTCLSLSSKLICHSSTTSHLFGLLRAHFLLFAARDNWDGILSEAATFQKQFSLTDQSLIKTVKVLLLIASMVAAYNMGNIKGARKYVSLLLETNPPFQSANELPLSSLNSFKIFDRVREEMVSETYMSRSSKSTSTASTSSGQQVAQKKQKKKKKAKQSITRTQPSSSAESPPSVSSSSSSSASVAHAPDPSPAVAPDPVEDPFDPPPKSSSNSAVPSSSSSSPPPPPSPPPISFVVEKASSGSEDALSIAPARLVYAECSICFENFPDWAAVPCGHVFCEACIRKIQPCPVCRQDIQLRIRLFLSLNNAQDADTKSVN